MTNNRRALIVGINDYRINPLKGCVNDAEQISDLLERNYDGTKNFDVKLIKDIQTKGELLGNIKELFSDDSEVALFYYSGHGYVNELGGYIVTPDYTENDWGIKMNDIVNLANKSKCKNKIVILDCCFSGSISNIDINDNVSAIGNGVTILTASRSNETSMETNENGVFTQLLKMALNGEAANIQGEITPGSIYAYIDQSLGVWSTQRPLFKTNISSFICLRKANPRINYMELKTLLNCFKDEDAEFKLNPSYEYTNSLETDIVPIEPYAKPDNVKIFKVLQRLESVDLVEPVDEEHMYFAAMNSKSCRLTPLGKYYWRLLKDKKI